jgi:hypothetical protein
MNRQLIIYFLCALVICAILGCSVSTKMTLLNGKTRSPISPGDVIIFESSDKVTGDYEEIGLITSHGDYQHTDLAEMYESMREEAAKVGANGIILGPIEDPPTHQQVLNHFFPTKLERRGKATAIYVFTQKKQE